jgi:hypothetical protein
MYKFKNFKSIIQTRKFRQKNLNAYKILLYLKTFFHQNTLLLVYIKMAYMFLIIRKKSRVAQKYNRLGFQLGFDLLCRGRKTASKIVEDLGFFKSGGHFLSTFARQIVGSPKSLTTVSHWGCQYSYVCVMWIRV